MHVTEVFLYFAIRRSERRALLVGAKQFLYISSIFMVSFGEINMKVLQVLLMI